MTEFTAILHAIASILWPIFAFTALFVFKSQIADLAKRLKKGKLLGQEIELEKSLEELRSDFAVVREAITEEESRDFHAMNFKNDEISDFQKSILIALASHPKYSLRSLTGITENLRSKSEVDREAVRVNLNELAKYGLVTEVLGKSGIGSRWSITNIGKQLLDKVYSCNK